MKEASSLSLLFIILVFIVVKAAAIKCFKCNSVYDPECLSLNTTRSNKFIVDCDKIRHQHFKNLNSSFCSKLYQKGEVEKCQLKNI